MSEQVERRLVDLLDDPVVSPYGNPIPGLSELQGQASVESVIVRPGGDQLTVALTRPGRFRVVRLTEAVQTDPDLLQELASAGVMPGAVIEASAADGYVAVHAAVSDGSDAGERTGTVLEVSEETASHIRVARLQ